MERDAANLESLKKEINELGKLPDNITTHMIEGDCFETLSRIVETLRNENRRMAPAFVFVDPYGFKVPGRLLRELMTFKGVELFINVIWRELDMAIKQGNSPGMAKALDEVYVRKWNDPKQQFLITPEPDLIHLENWVIGRLATGPTHWHELLRELRPEIWREPHLNEVIRILRNSGRIDADQYEGRFSPVNNPRLFLVTV